MSRRRKEKRRLAQIAKKRRNKIFKIAGGLILAAGITGGVIYSSLERRVNREVRIPSKISFRQAVTNENYRQEFLNQLLERGIKENPDWEGFERFVYYSSFSKEKENGNNYGKLEGKFVALAYTETERNKKAKCNMSSRIFQFAKTEEEFKSLLDNEAFHAYCFWANYLPYKIKFSKYNASDETIKMAFEAMSFDYQLSLINAGKRKVGYNFKVKNAQAYHQIWRNLAEIGKGEDSNGKLARDVLSNLKMKIIEKKNINYNE